MNPQVMERRVGMRQLRDPGQQPRAKIESFELRWSSYPFLEGNTPGPAKRMHDILTFRWVILTFSGLTLSCCQHVGFLNDE